MAGQHHSTGTWPCWVLPGLLQHSGTLVLLLWMPAAAQETQGVQCMTQGLPVTYKDFCLSLHSLSKKESKWCETHGTRSCATQ